MPNLKRPLLTAFLVLLTSAYIANSMPAIDGKGPEPRMTKSGTLLNQPNPRMKGKSITGSWKALIILIDFPDYRWDHATDTNFVNDSLYYTADHFDSLANSLGTFRHPECVSNVTGSIRDFYIENSYGQFDVISTVSGWYTAANNFSYYSNNNGFGSYPNNAERLVEEAVAAADPFVDFSQYDNDGDGWVDALYVVHAGPGAEALPVAVRDDYIWSHASGIGSQILDGVYVSTYSTEPEDGKTGVFCHEFGHVIGLPDLYDYTYLSSGVGEWCAMAGGSWGHRDSADLRGTAPTHFSAWCKKEMGWINPVNLTRNQLGQTIPPAELSPVAYRLWDNGDSTGTQYFLVENRQNIGFDSGFTRRQLNYGLPRGHGLLVWHVDESIYGNDDRTHKMVDLEESSPVTINGFHLEHLDTVRTQPIDKFLYNGNRGDDGDPWPGYLTCASDSIHFSGNRDKNEFNQYSIPSSKNYAGTNTLAGAENITENGTSITADLFVSVDAAVAYPGLGDSLAQAQNVNIIWHSSAAGGVLCDSLYFSSDSTGTWSLAGCSNAGDSLLPWVVPAVTSGRCFIKVVTRTNAGSKISHLSSKFSVGLTGVEGDPMANLRDLKYRLLPAQPNPSSHGIVTVSFEIPSSQRVELKILNILGQPVKTLAAGQYQAGRHDIKWDGRDERGVRSAPGIYLYQLKTADFSKINKLVIVK
jgi:immune inhibitor A